MDVLTNYPWMPDAALAAVFLCFACAKGKKGLYKMLMPAIVLVLSLVCASILSAVLTKPVTDLVYPVVENRVVAKLDMEKYSQENAEKLMSYIQNEADLTELVEEILPENIVSVSKKLGVNVKALAEKTAKKLSEDGKPAFELTEEQITKLEKAGVLVKDTVGAAAAQTAQKAEEAMLSVAFTLARQVTATAVHYLLWGILMVAFLAIFTVIKNALGLAFDLPVIGWVDKLGGALVGVVECGLAVFVMGWLLKAFGVTILQELAAGTKLLRWFV